MEKEGTIVIQDKDITTKGSEAVEGNAITLKGQMMLQNQGVRHGKN
jgi:hypothetical protein